MLNKNEKDALKLMNVEAGSECAYVILYDGLSGVWNFKMQDYLLYEVKDHQFVTEIDKWLKAEHDRKLAESKRRTSLLNRTPFSVAGRSGR